MTSDAPPLQLDRIELTLPSAAGPVSILKGLDLTVEVRTNRSDVKHCETVPGPPVRSTSARASTFLMQTPAISAGLLRTRADASARNRLQHNTITTITDARVSGG